MTTTSAQSPRITIRGSFQSFPYWHELILALLSVALLIGAYLLEPRFLSSRAQLELSTHIWELALLTLPMTLIIITAGIDLSVGSTMALCAVVLGLTYEHHFPLPVACLFAILTGIACGLLNGVFISYIRVHPLIVTLATLSAYRGIAEGISLARPISGFPASFQNLSGTLAILHLPRWLSFLSNVPIPGLLFAALAILVFILLSKTPFGRSLYAIGYNETAVSFSGINVPRIKLFLYTLAGFIASISAILFVARRNTAKADVGAGIELDVITAVVLGGVSIFGGRGNIVGTLLGIFLIHETREFVSWHYQNDELILLVLAVLLILSVLLNTLLTPKRR